VYAITRDTIAIVSGVASSNLPGGSSRRKMMSLDADLQFNVFVQLPIIGKVVP